MSSAQQILDEVYRIADSAGYAVQVTGGDTITTASGVVYIIVSATNTTLTVYPDIPVPCIEHWEEPREDIHWRRPWKVAPRRISRHTGYKRFVGNSLSACQRTRHKRKMFVQKLKDMG